MYFSTFVALKIRINRDETKSLKSEIRNSKIELIIQGIDTEIKPFPKEFDNEIIAIIKIMITTNKINIVEKLINLLYSEIFLAFCIFDSDISSSFISFSYISITLYY